MSSIPSYQESDHFYHRSIDIRDKVSSKIVELASDKFKTAPTEGFFVEKEALELVKKGLSDFEGELRKEYSDPRWNNLIVMTIRSSRISHFLSSGALFGHVRSILSGKDFE